MVENTESRYLETTQTDVGDMVQNTARFPADARGFISPTTFPPDMVEKRSFPHLEMNTDGDSTDDGDGNAC